MQQIKFFIFSICIIILFNTTLIKATEQKEIIEYPYYTFDLYCKIYEFHPEYIKIIDYAEISTNGENFGLSKINFFSSGALWNEKDLYEFEFSKNIGSFDSTVDEYEHNKYINFEVHFKEALKGGKKYSFWISYKTKRLPHLHTKENISRNIELHFGLNTGPAEDTPRKYRILTIPSDSENQSAFNYLPTKQIEKGNWKLFIYDLSEIKQRVSMHIRFRMGEEKERLRIEEIIKEL